MKNELNTLRSLYVKKRIEEIQLNKLLEEKNIQTHALESKNDKTKPNELENIDEHSTVKNQLKSRYAKKKLEEIHKKIPLQELFGSSKEAKVVDKSAIDQARIQKLTKGMDALEAILKRQGFIPKLKSVQTAFQNAAKNMLEFENKKIDILGRNARKLADVGNFLDVLVTTLKTSLPNLRKTLARALGEEKFKALQDKITKEPDKVRADLESSRSELILRIFETALHEQAPGTTTTSGQESTNTGDTKIDDTKAEDTKQTSQKEQPGAKKNEKENEVVLNKNDIKQIKNAYNLFRQTLQRESTGMLDWWLGRHQFGGGIAASKIIPDHEEFAKDMFFHALSNTYKDTMSMGRDGAQRIQAALQQPDSAAAQDADNESEESSKERKSNETDVKTVINDITSDNITKDELDSIVKAVVALRDKRRKGTAKKAE